MTPSEVLEKAISKAMKLHFHKWSTFDIATFSDLPTQIIQRCWRCDRTRVIIEDPIKYLEENM